MTGGDRARRLGRAVQALAVGVLLAVVVARCVLGETAFRVSPLRLAGLTSADAGDVLALPADRVDLSRATFAIALLSAAGLWLIGGALRRRARLRHPALAIAAAGLVAWLGVAAMYASDARAAQLAWLEQAALLAGVVMAASALSSPRALRLAVVVLAALAGLLSAKGIWQVAIEAPERVADFEMYRAQRLAAMGWQAGSAQARLIESRLRDASALGYFNLANVFASVLIVLTPVTAGLGIDKLAGYLRRPIGAPPPRKGEVPLPVLAALGTLLLACGALAAMVLTRSRAGVALGLAVLAGGGLALAGRRWLARRRRRAIAGGLVLFLLLAGGVVALGLSRDALPGKSLTFRWFYWTASGRIAADHPVRGVGPGNFPDAYLAHRRASAEEAVKAPHNVLLRAAAEGGLPAAVLTGGILLYAALGAMAPARAGVIQPRRAPAAWRAWQLALLASAGAGVVIASRTIFDVAGSAGALFLLDALLPGAALAGALLVSGWTSRPFAPGPAVRTGLAAGAVGLIVHNLVSFSLAMPGSATLGWVSMGAALACVRARTVRLNPRVALAGGLAVLIGSAAAGGLIARPVAARIAASDDVLTCIRQDRRPPAVAAAKRAAEADPLDPVAAADAARVIAWATPPAGPPVIRASLARAVEWARQAVTRDPADPAHRRLLGRMQFHLALPDAMLYRWRRHHASEQDLARLRVLARRHPRDPRVLSDLAEVLLLNDQPEAATDQLRSAIVLQPAAQLYLHLGDALYQADRPGEAAEAWRRGRSMRSEHGNSFEGPMLAAVQRDPMDIRLRLELAGMYSDVGRDAEALSQLAEARRLEDSLLQPSVEEFTPRERRRMAILRARAKAAP